MPPPLVSILMPVRNAAPTIDATLRSVLRQRGARWECVVVDDGSDDDTADRLRRAAESDPRFAIESGPAQGLVPSLMRGLERCRGELVARLDGDDLMHRDRLRLQAELLAERPELCGVGCHVRLFPRRHLQAGRLAYERWLNSLSDERDVRRDAFIECPLAHPGLMMRRDALLELGYRDAGWPEDYDLVLRALAAGHQLGVVPRRLLHWRDGSGRLSRTSPTYGIDRFTRCKAHFLARGLLRRCDRYVLWGYGKTGRSLARALRGEGKRPAAIVELHPGRLGQRIAGAPVIPPPALPHRLELERLPVVASVARAGPRSEVRAALAALGLREGRDFVCAA